MFEILCALSLIILIIRQYFKKKVLEKQFPVIDDYLAVSLPNRDSWRWRFPIPTVVNLKLEDTESESILYISSYLLDSEKIITIFGYIFIILAVYLLDVGFYQQTNFILLLFPLGLVTALAMGFLMVGERVVQIILQPQYITIVIEFGFWLKRKVHFKRDKSWQFQAAYQPSYEMNKDQVNPLVVLSALKPTLLGHSRYRYFLCCNQSEGSWIAAGLNYWTAY